MKTLVTFFSSINQHAINRHKPSRPLLWLPLFICLGLTGCAHQQLMETGDEHQRQGRYEQAVEHYQQALALEPNDKVNQAKLNQAQKALDRWLDNINQQADDAKKRGLTGRALVLYAKVAQLRQDPNAINQYKQLYSAIADQHRYKIALTSPAELGRLSASDVANVVQIPSADSREPNQFSATVTIDSPTFTSAQTSIEKSQSYVSGTETIANPKYLELQRSIQQHREQIDQLYDENDELRTTAEQRRLRAVNSQNELTIAQIKWGNETTAKDRPQLKELVTKLEAANKRAEKSAIAAQKAVERSNNELKEARSSLTKLLNDLSYLPPTVEQDVLADHHYPVMAHTRTATGAFTFKINGLPALRNPVTVSDTDESHDAQAIIALKANPINLISDADLQQLYLANVRQQLAQQIELAAQHYRLALKDQANQQINIDQRFEAYVQYALSGTEAVDGQTAGRMKRQLESEFGVAGDFPINQLLLESKLLFGE